MKLRRLTSSGRRRAAIDDAFAAYSAWRQQSAAARAAYVTWARAARSDARFAFAAYRAALDREERAADIFARRLHRAQRRRKLNVITQLAQLPAPSGAM